MVAVVMILMHRYHYRRSIHNGMPVLQRLPDHPVVPTYPPHNERRKILAIYSPRKRKIINPPSVTLPAFFQGALPHLVFPMSRLEVNRLPNLRIPPSSNHQKSRMDRAHPAQRLAKVRHKHNVAIRIAEHVVSGDLLCSAEHEIRSPRLLYSVFNTRLVTESKFPAHFRRPLVVPEEDHFRARVQQPPAIQRIALDDCAVALKRFRGREESQHRPPKRENTASLRS